MIEFRNVSKAYAINNGKNIVISDSRDHWILGTPEEYKTFLTAKI